MGRVMTFLLVAFLLCLPAASAVAFEGNTVAMGGKGGSKFYDNCNRGQNIVAVHDALVLIDWVSGKDIDMVRANCTAVHDGVPDPATYPLGWRGKSGDNGRFNGVSYNVCPRAMVVQALHASESAVRLVHQFWFTCRNLVTGEHADSARSSTLGGKGGAPGVVDCGDDAYAYGLLGRYGTNIDALGLMCTTYRPPAVNNPPPQGKKPVKITGKPRTTVPASEPGKPPLKVNNGGDAGDGGVGVSAANDTTIYDKPDGSDVANLSAGDPVTIVRCNPRNWCQISQPENGWVWGDDLNR